MTDVKIKRNDFLNLLRWAQGIAERRTTMQILSNLLLEVRDKILRVTATDLECTLTTEGTVEGKGSVRWVVNARHLFEMVREASTDELGLAEVESHGLEVTFGKGRFRMVGMNPDDFPAVPTFSSKEEVPLNPEDIQEMLEATSYAISSDETRYTLCSLYLTQVARTGQGPLLRVVATDGHRLSYSERGVDSKLKLPKGLLIPRKGIQELAKLLNEETGEVLFSGDEKAVRFRRGPVTLLIRLVEGEFPAYDQVIPKQLDRIVSIDRGLLVGALKRAAILTSGDGRGVRIDVSSGLLDVTSQNPDLGESKEEITADYKGPQFQIAFNPRYLLDVLSVVRDDKVILELKDDVSPCVIRSEFDKGFLALIMPMRL